jgi:putative restriction endonuclease
MCRITGISDQNYLVASHIKPWCESDNNERLDGNNGLLLSPHIDRLFDRGWISFEDDGRLIVCNDATKQVMNAWGLDHNLNVGNFSDCQKRYLAYHREAILKKK